MGSSLTRALRMRSTCRGGPPGARGPAQARAPWQGRLVEGTACSVTVFLVGSGAIQMSPHLPVPIQETRCATLALRCTGGTLLHPYIHQEEKCDVLQSGK